MILCLLVFLSTVVYAENFGYTTKGATSFTKGSIIEGSKFTCPHNGILKSITAYIKSSSVTRSKCAIYKVSDNKLVAWTIEKNQIFEKNWYTFDLNTSYENLSANKEYWVVIWMDNPIEIWYDSGIGANQNYGYSNDFPNLFSPLGVGMKFSIYATYDVINDPPKWSFPNNLTPKSYYSSTESQFNITWQDDESVDKVLIEIKDSLDNVIANNNTMTNIEGNIYTYSIVLPAGNFTWKSYATDNKDKWNSSDSWNILIDKTESELSLSCDDVTYPTSVYCTASESNIGDKDLIYNFYVDGILKDSGSIIDYIELLGTGIYELEYNTTEGENYTSNSKKLNLTVNQNQTNPVDIYIDNYKNQNVTVNSGTEITVNATIVYSQSGTALLWRDGIDVSNPETITLNPGTYEYKANVSGNVNYYSNDTGVVFYVNVNQPTTTTTASPVVLYLGGGGLPPLETEEETEATETETTEELTTVTCDESWSCTEWSECIDGTQTRTCTDSKNCGTTVNKPLESQNCVVETGPTGATAAPTGLFLGVDTTDLLVLGIATILTIVVVVFALISKRKGKVEEVQLY